VRIKTNSFSVPSANPDQIVFDPGFVGVNGATT